MSSTTTKTLSVATTLAVVGSVAALGAFSSGQTPAIEPVSYTVPASTLHAVAASNALAPRTDQRSTFAERASRDAADRAARLKKLKAAKLKAAKAKAAKAAKLKAAKARKAAASGPAVPAGSTRALGKKMAAKYGWTGGQWAALERLWTAESSWRPGAGNPSGAYGIPQALPGSKMASAGADWRTNPATQIEWGLNYIDKRWGSPANAWSHFQAAHWY